MFKTQSLGVQGLARQYVKTVVYKLFILGKGRPFQYLVASIALIVPVLQGLNKPVNDLSRGCNADDVYKLTLITAAQAVHQ